MKFVHVTFSPTVTVVVTSSSVIMMIVDLVVKEGWESHCGS